MGWPNGATLVAGVRIHDVVPFGRETVVVGSKRVSPRGPSELALDDRAVAACDPIIAYAYGPDRAAIPASMGGPLTLAMTDDCPSRRPWWPTFVESIAVVAP